MAGPPKTLHPDQVAKVVGASSCNQEVVGLIPGQGTCLGFVFNPQSGSVWEVTKLSLSLSLCLPVSLKSIKISSDKGLKIKSSIISVFL